MHHVYFARAAQNYGVHAVGPNVLEHSHRFVPGGVSKRTHRDPFRCCCRTPSRKPSKSLKVGQTFAGKQEIREASFYAEISEKRKLFLKQEKLV